MTRSSKVLIVAAIPIGAVGFLLDTPWSVIAAGLDLLLVVAAIIGPIARDWTFKDRHANTVHIARYHLGPDTLDVSQQAQQAGPDDAARNASNALAAHRRRRRLLGARESFAPTTRVRRAARQVRAFTDIEEIARASEQEVDPAQETVAVRSRVDELLAFSIRADRENRRAAVWWFVAAVAVSIPVGVLVNVLTG